MPGYRRTKASSERETAVSLSLNPHASGGCLPSLTLVVSRHSRVMKPLTDEEDAVLRELTRLAGSDRVVTGLELLDQGFADFICKVYHKRLGYPGSLQSRTFQILRDKGYIKMERRNRGTYTILQP